MQSVRDRNTTPIQPELIMAANLANFLPVACTPRPRPRILIERVSGLLDSGAPLEKISPPLLELLQHVESHLVYDLDDNFYEEAVFENPWLTRATKALCQQQTELETSLFRLRRSLQLGNQSQPPKADLRHRFEHFIDIFFEHEAGIQTFVQCKSGAY